MTVWLPRGGPAVHRLRVPWRRPRSGRHHLPGPGRGHHLGVRLLTTVSGAPPAATLLLRRKGVILGRTQRYVLLKDRGRWRRSSAHGASPLKRVHPCDYGIGGSLDVSDGTQNLIRCQRSSLWRGDWAVTMSSAPAVTVAIASPFSPVVGVRRHRGRQGRISMSKLLCTTAAVTMPSIPPLQEVPVWSREPAASSLVRHGPGPVSIPGPVLVWSRSGPGPMPVLSGPGPVSFGREDGSVRVRRWPGAVAQPYRSTGAPPKRLAAQSLRRSPKRRVGGPNATTTVLGPRSQGGNATTTVLGPRSQGGNATTTVPGR